MREITCETIIEKLSDLLVSINYKLNNQEISALQYAYDKETNQTGKKILGTIVDNLSIAEQIGVPICQDTGMAVIFLDIGQDVHITGGYINDAINTAVKKAYTGAYLRASVVYDPIYDRTNTKDNTPAVIYTQIVKGDKLRISATAKGFGSENMAKIKMFNPTATEDEIIDFIVESVKSAGSNPCPPIQIGIGIGGTFEKAALLAKKSLLRGINTQNSNEKYAELEKKILKRVNETNIGPQGFGGITTALGVNIEYYPTHIAGLPVAVNINCHVMRHGTIEL